MHAVAESRIFAGFIKLAALGLAIGLAPAAGCSQSGSTTSPGSAGAPAKTLGDAKQVIERMAAAYRDAESYADAGQFRLQFERGDERVDESIDFSVTFARPNQIRIHAYQAIVVCDGRHFRATVADLPGQVLERPAPDELTVENLFNDPGLYAALGGQIAGAPFQLGLLLDKSSPEFILKNAEQPKLLAAKKIEDQPCYGVELDRNDGKLVLWIDQNTFALRRLEFPTGDFGEKLAAGGGPKVVGLALTADFKGATFNRKLPETAFDFEVPLDAKLVERFNLLPPPHESLGKQVKDFAFESLDKKSIDRESLAGKIVVIDFWATWCDPCIKSLPNLQLVYDRFKDNDKIAILAVSTDEPTTPDDELTAKFEAAKATIPIYRDLDRYNASVFQVRYLPTTIILGADGKVQDFEIGFKEKLATELPAKLQKLLDGKNLYEETIAAYEAGGKLPPAIAPVEAAKIAKPSEPERLKLKKLWKFSELERAGNLLVVPATEGDDQMFVLDNWKSVVELAAGGSALARHALELPEQPEALVSYLRTAVDKDGERYFAGSAVGVQQVHVFDRQWKTLLSYPSTRTPGGVADLQLGDLDGDGQPELNIGYWGDLGVESVSLAGKQLWSASAVGNILRMALGGADDQGRRGLLVSSMNGAITPIDSTGTAEKPIVLDGRFVRLVYAADLNGDGQVEICAIAQSKQGDGELGHDVAVGLSPSGEELWTYDLPGGVHRDAALEIAAWGKLLDGDESQWLLAGADGSIHIVSAKGEAIDRFNYGAPLSGLAAAQLDGRRVLLISSEQSVEALQVEP